MSSPEPDLQQRIIERLGRGEKELADHGQLLDPFQYVASANYVVPMLLDLAIKRGDEIVDHVPRYNSLDHAVNWQVLAASIGRFDDFIAPYFDRAILSDPFAEELLAYEGRKHERRHAIASFRQGLWRLVSDDDGLRVVLAKPVRRSALHLVSELASRAQYPAEVIEQLDQKSGELDLGALALKMGLRELDVFSQSAPDGWEAFCVGVGFPMGMVPQFRSWVIDLWKTHPRRWFSPDELWADWCSFATEKEFEVREPGQFDALLSLHTVTPQEAVTWGVQAPFLRCGEFLASWPFAFHVLYPDLGFISLLVRRHERLWSTTVGSSLALAADWLGAQLPQHSRLAWAARRARRGVGDADLVLWDRQTDDVVVVELKTTYDKFRSHAQLQNFVDQRVNFPKAIKQANRTAAAIRDGSWPLRDIFGKAAPALPRSVTPCVLTWWDTYNPTLGSEDEIVSCNFATFIYVISLAKGDVSASITTLRELARIYCPGVLKPVHVTLDESELSIRREVQGADLPPQATWPPTSQLTDELLRAWRPWPPDWHEGDGDGSRPRLFVYNDKEDDHETSPRPAAREQP
ncbi:hypothetical protein [Amycolatopsis sp. cmx-11-32]|uniref:hypothetical protein n=1 Tax=Amycolatopsis sp. cmx-11-32 TaxID=2785796 RepID=UPI0039E619EE